MAAKRNTAPPMITRDLTRFLRENLHTIRDEDEEAKFTQVRVCQIVKGKKGEETFSITVPRKPSENWPEQTALDIYVRLQAEAGVLRGLQKFAVYAYFSHDLDNHVARYLLALQGGQEDSDDMETEGPTKDGLLSQLMRHNEALTKVNVSMQMSTHSAMQGIIAKLSELSENLIDKRMASLQAEEDARNMTHERELAARMAEKKMDAITDVGKKLGMFVPAIANRLAGQTLFPVQGSAVTMMLKGLMGSLMTDEKRATALMQILKEEERIVFLQLFEELGKADESSPSSEGATTADGQGPS